MKKFLVIGLCCIGFSALATEKAKELTHLLLKDDLNVFLDGGSSSFADDVPTVTASKLIADYENNQARYERDYNKKLVRIKTVASGVKTDVFGSPYVVANGKNQFEQVSLFLKDKDKAIDINKGDRLDLICLGTKDNVMFPQLNKCVETKGYIADLIDLNKNYLDKMSDSDNKSSTIIGAYYLAFSEYDKANPNKLIKYNGINSLFKDKQFFNEMTSLAVTKIEKKGLPFAKLPTL